MGKTGEDNFTSMTLAAFRPLELVSQLGQIATTGILEFAPFEQIPDAFSRVEQEINAANRLKHQVRITGILPIQAGKVDTHALLPLWGVYNIFDATVDYGAARDSVLRALGLLPATGVSPAVISHRPTKRANDHIKRGTALAPQLKEEEVLVALERMLALRPNSTMNWHHVGSTLIHLKRYEEALAAYERGAPKRREWFSSATRLVGPS